MTMTLGIFSPHLFIRMWIPIKKCLMRRKAKQIKLHKDLETLYTPPQFDIVYRYSGVLNILFVSFIFAAGMPLLSCLATFTLLGKYWFDKWKGIHVVEPGI